MTHRIVRATWAAMAFSGLAWTIATPAAAQPAAISTAVPADIPVGPADENLETSRGVSTIMDNCIFAYSAISHMHAEGTYITINKSEDEETSHQQATVSLDYRRPAQMSIVSKSDDAGLNCSFTANGTTVTMINAGDYYQMPQPAGLSAFSDSYRAGEIYQEKSGAMAISTIAPMFMSEDPANILLAGIARYVYEGEEETAGVDCHRIRFIQEDPDVIVILWIDKATWLVRKTSFIYSYDAKYNMMESFEEGVNSSMAIMTWDNLSTAPEQVNNNAFSPDIPPSAEETTAKEQSSPHKHSKTSLWESIVSSAAKDSPEATTWSLSRDFGTVELQLQRFAELPESILDFTPCRLAETDKPLLGVATQNGSITLHGRDGAISSKISLDENLLEFASMDTASSGPLFLTVDQDTSQLSAHNLQGDLVWAYRSPTATIRWLAVTTGTERAIYLSLSGRGGIRKLDENGKVLFANGNIEWAGRLIAAPAGSERIVYGGLYEIGIVNKSLKVLNTFDTDETVPSLLWDSENPAAPIVNLAISEDSDALLQRRTETGEIIWTTMIAPKAEEVSGSNIAWARLRIDGAVQRCILILLSDGQVVIANAAGKVIYRAQVSANDALVKRNDGAVIQNIAVADINQDGVDEVYTKIDTHLMQLTTP